MHFNAYQSITISAAFLSALVLQHLEFRTDDDL